MSAQPSPSACAIAHGIRHSRAPRDASFDVHRGEILVILGGSGSGKSSLMKNIIGLYAPMAGDILIDGRVSSARRRRKARLQRKLGVMYQSGALFGSLTVLENVRFPLDRFTDLPLAQRNLTARMLLRQSRWRMPSPYAGRSCPAECSSGRASPGRSRSAVTSCSSMSPRPGSIPSRPPISIARSLRCAGIWVSPSSS